MSGDKVLLKQLEPQPGTLYEHFKAGDVYEVVVVARCEATHVSLVVYRNVRSGMVWSRPLSEFTAMVEVASTDGPDVLRVPRFKPLPHAAAAEHHGGKDTAATLVSTAFAAVAERLTQMEVAVRDDIRAMREGSHGSPCTCCADIRLHVRERQQLLDSLRLVGQAFREVRVPADAKPPSRG